MRGGVSGGSGSASEVIRLSAMDGSVFMHSAIASIWVRSRLKIGGFPWDILVRYIMQMFWDNGLFPPLGVHLAVLDVISFGDLQKTHDPPPCPLPRKDGGR